MSIVEFIYLAVFMIGCVLVYFAYTFYQETKYLLDDGIRAKATVVDLIESYSDEDIMYKPVFEYLDYGGNTASFESSVSSNPAPYSIGDSVKIIYSKDGDDHRVESFWGLYRWTIILLCIASPFLIIGASYLLYARL